MAKTKVNAAAAANESVISAKVVSYRLGKINLSNGVLRRIDVTFDKDFPCFDDEGNKSTTNTLRYTLKQFIALVIKNRQEMSAPMNKITLASPDQSSTMLDCFIQMVTEDATYDIDAIDYKEGDTFEDGTVAEHDGYRYDIVGIKFAPIVEANYKPRTLNDALAMFK